MKYGLYFLVLFVITACGSSELKSDFNCSNASYSNLSKTEDVRNLFSVQLPKNWKVNLYYDNDQTSIYAADTTLNLTKTTLFDASYIHAPVFFDATFKQKINADNVQMGLEEVKSKDIKYLDKTSFYSLAKGKKGKYTYHILNVFTKVNTDNFLHVKTEIYGDSLVNERICKAISLLDKIEVK